MSYRVLIVDDTETMRRYEHLLLSEEGYDLDMATNGVEALERVSKAQPDLILLDIMMPEMDGIECCRRIKSNEASSNVKIIMVTTKGEYNRVKEAFSAGCDDYVTKPIDRLELLSKIRELLKFKKFSPL